MQELQDVNVHVVKPLVLIVDDEKSIRDTLAGVLADEGYDSIGAKNGREALGRYLKDKPDLVLLDVWMPGGMDGIETLQRMKEIGTDIPVIVMSGHGNIETAVRATKLGAFDFLEKPLSLDKLLPLLDHIKSIRQSKQQKSSSPLGQYEIIGDSDAINAVKKQVALVAPRNSWVLITGENGTGKEVVARNIHIKSSRVAKPFVAVNCAAIPETLIESELFGYSKGAFTNALSNKIGKFEQAHQGTLFLDEIGEMSLQTQAKILRILQEQTFERLGGVDTIKVDVRVIAATNKDLNEEIQAGHFREDLYYRLNVVPFHLPPLRERGRDILMLAQHFLETMSRELNEPRKTLTSAAEEMLLRNYWPGNIRELKNLLERLCIMVPEAEITEVHLGEVIPGGDKNRDMMHFNAGSATLKQAKNDFERAFILEKLEEFGWNVSKTAEAIGVERSNLHRKLKTYDIDTKKLKG